MKDKKKIGIHQLYGRDAEKADERLWGRSHGMPNRRGFLKKSALTAMSMMLGAEMVYASYFPEGLIPAAFAYSDEPFTLPGKDSNLIVLNDKPINAETPPHLLDDHLTPRNLFFVRNNGIPPEKDKIDPSKWTLEIEGESAKRKKTFTLPQLKNQFKHYTYQLTLECGGNGRKEFNPPAKGNQWSVGAVGCASFTGVRLRDVLQAVGVKSNAV